MTSRLKPSTICGYFSAGFLLLVSSISTLLDASIVYDDLRSLSSVKAVPRRSVVHHDVRMDSCPGVLVNGPGSCHCSALAEIHCENLTAVPEFRRHGARYSAVYMDQQDISSLPAAAFRHLHVSRIVLNFNPLGEGGGLSADALHGLDKSVRELELGGCQLSELPETLLNGSSRIRRIPGGFFGGADELRELLLWGNELDELDALSLGGLWNLRRLDLDHNRLTKISKDTFRHLLELHSLRLNDNRVEALYAETFLYMESLKSLSLERNNITYVHERAFVERAFVGLSTLISLSLSANRISYLPNELFSPLVNLLILKLDSNRIEYVWPRTFIGLGELRRLDLSGNAIGGLPDGALRHSPKLQRLMLDNNRLTTIRQCSMATGAADMPPYLRTLSLVGNPLYCDCRVAWLLGMRKPTTVWWAACLGGHGDNQTSTVRHYSYYGLTRHDVCVASASLNQHCPFNA